ncbi:MAG: hypothetical protein LCH91_27050 [Bacteroidetes bacterium]|nr:hypothetical protein [Bacteroidota bacterium]
MEYKILEYNPCNGVWHIQDGRRQQNIGGWFTISDHILESDAHKFCDGIEEIYPRIGFLDNPNHYPPYPSLQTIKREFERFLFWKNKFTN